MYIIIAGGGQVGSELANQLVQQKHDVIVIEKDKNRCDKIYSQTGAVVINGGVTSIEILKEAGIEKAEICIAATEQDTDNLSFSLLCKSFDVPRIIARLRNPEYERSYKVAGVNSIVRVTDILVDQIITELEERKVKKIASIGKSDANIYKMVLSERSILHGKTVLEVTKISGFPKNLVFVAIGKVDNNSFIIPHGDTKIEAMQELIFICRREYLDQAVQILGEEFPDRRK